MKLTFMVNGQEFKINEHSIAKDIIMFWNLQEKDFRERERLINPEFQRFHKNLSYIPIFDNVLIFKKQSKILPINFINYFIAQKNPILRINGKDVYSLISQETFNIQVINLDEIKITFDKSNIDYYNLLIVLKNMCNLEFTTNDFLFQLIY